MLQQIIKNSFILSFGILLGRLSGFIRELLISRIFGASTDADLIILMLTVPDLLNNLIMMGAVTGVLIPILANHGKDLSNVIFDFTRKLLFIALVLYLIIIFFFYIGYNWKSFILIFISMVSVFPNVFTFILTSLLQFEKRFAVQSLNTLIFNLCIILALVLGAKEYYFALSIVLASIIRLMWVSWDIKRSELSTKIIRKKSTVRNMYVSYSSLTFMLLANGLMFILPIIDKVTASFLYEGAVATLSYAEKIYLLPVSIFLTTFAIALFPDASRLVSGQEYEEIFNILKKAIPLNLLVSAFVVVFFIFWGGQISHLIFGWLGGLEISETIEISKILKCYLPVVFFAGSISILLNILFAFKAYKYIFLYSCSLFVFKIVLNSFIVNLNLEIIYVALSSSLISICAFVILGIMCFIKIKQSREIVL